MNICTSKLATLVAVPMCLNLPQFSYAETPTLQTKGPVIHLFDYLNEEASLGWCIDTVGRGKSDKLHAHSCKPEGDDVLFSFSPESGLIQSATYEGVCMAYNAPRKPPCLSA